MQMLKQEQYKPYKLYEQVLILVLVLNHVFQDVPVNSIKNTTADILALFEEKHFDIVDRIQTTGLLGNEDKEKMIEIAKKFLQER